MAGRLSHIASKIMGGNGVVSRSVANSLRVRAGMGLPVGKHIVPDKPVSLSCLPKTLLCPHTYIEFRLQFLWFHLDRSYIKSRFDSVYMDFSTSFGAFITIDSNLKFRFDSLCVDFDIEFWSLKQLLTSLDCKKIVANSLISRQLIKKKERKMRLERSN